MNANNNISERVSKLRKLMDSSNINTYIITKSDPHQSEYAPSYWNGVKFISGFTGSAGTVVITKDTAGLWADGRYYIQAERELSGSGIILHKEADYGVKDFLSFAGENTPKGGIIAFDGTTISLKEFDNLSKAINYKNITLKTDIDLLGEIWENRPLLSTAPVYDHLIEFCGEPRKDKIARVRASMAKEGADIYLISSNDDIAWLFNVRGQELPGVNFFASFAVIEQNTASVFIDKNRSGDVKDLLLKDGVALYDYADIEGFLGKLSLSNNSSTATKKTIMLNPKKTSYSLYNALKNLNIIRREQDITTEFKAVKNSVELDNLEKANVRDGVAMVKFIKWLQSEVSKGEINEHEVSLKLTSFREAGENYVEPSFPTICGYMANAAMMHYSATKDMYDVLKPYGMVLIDSGGNYYDGMTDITRTIVLGDVTDQMKRDFTLVLKSHIALSKAVFLHGATGSNLDVIARMPMWENGMDYKSGTGHGIGFFLNVHEGPHSISKAQNPTALEPGMVTTIEPGVYRENEYGIRTENTAKVVEHQETEFGKFLKFDTFSYCHIDLRAVDASMLNEVETKWLNDYHQTVYNKLSFGLNDAEKAWLQEETRAI